MALKKSVNTIYGIEIVDAYHRVENVQLIEKQNITFQVRSYKDNTGLPHFADKTQTCFYDINGENPIKQAYEHLKTFPDYKDARDC